MDVLIAGHLSSLAASLAKTFLNERYKVVLVGNEANDLNLDSRNVSCYSVSPTVDYFKEIVSAHKFDVVVYLAAREETLLESNQQPAGQMLDGLLNTLELCKKEQIKRVFYVSSTEVYGSQPRRAEEDDTHPASPNGFAIKTSEQLCALYAEQYNLAPVVIRVPFVFGQGETASLMHNVIIKCKGRKKVVFPGPEDTTCSFLHAQDIANFILLAADEPGYGYRAVNLSSTDTLSFSELAGLLQNSFPEAKFEYDRSKTIFTSPAVGITARKSYDWLAERSLVNELPEVIADAGREKKPRKSLYEKLKSRFPRYTTYLKWAEVVLGAAAMHSLSMLSGAFIEFRYFDFRLAYVVLLGTVYGTQIGLIAALFASISLLLGWSALGLDLTELIYNVSNWLPFALYITAGMVTGYFHDKKENDIRNQNEQVNLVKEKYKFLYGLYQEVTELKNQFHKQLVGSRDSFGRIFHIARALDTLEEEEVIFKALNILEDVMDNRTIAIYSINRETHYARLEIYSSGLAGQIKKSLDLRNYPDLAESIEKDAIFQNRSMKDGYPAYLVPVSNGSRTVAAVVIWSASFDQYSLYYYNLLKVICGLIQSSINRVALFMDANADKFYIPRTKIMQPEPFKQVLKVKDKIKKNKLGDYLLVMVMPNDQENGHRNWETVYASVSKGTRAEDYIGVLDDHSCYILFSQAGLDNTSAILQRMAQLGITCCPITDPNPLFIDAPAASPTYGNFEQATALPG